MLRPFLLLCALLGGESALAGEDVYKVTFNGLRFGEMRLQIDRQPTLYKIEVHAEAQGFLGMVLRSKYFGQARGQITDTRLISKYFYVKSDRIFKRRITEINFVAGKPSKVSIKPLRDHTNLTDPAKVTDRRIDSLSGLMALFTAAPATCPGPLPLYDGRRLLSVTLAKSATSGTKTICKGTYRIDKGPDHSIQKGQRNFNLEFVYPAEGGAPESVEVTSGGNAVRLVRQ